MLSPQQLEQGLAQRRCLLTIHQVKGYGRAEVPHSKAQPCWGLLPDPTSWMGRGYGLRSLESVLDLGALTQLWTCWLPTGDSLPPPPWLSVEQVSGWLLLLLLAHPKRHTESLFTKQELGLEASPQTLRLMSSNTWNI